MVICKFYQRGDCKFGDRCRNEHPRGSSSGGGGGGNYGYGGGDSYYNPRGGGGGGSGYNQGGQQSTKGRGAGTGGYGYAQPQSQSGYHNPYVYHKNNVGGFDGRGGREGEAKKVHFKDSFGTSQNRFGALSNDQTGHHGQSERNDNIKEHEILDGIKSDMEEWEASKMWPLSSYKPNKSQGHIPGLEDISPDEIRYVAYTAEKENKFDQHKASLASVLDMYKRQINQLKKPSREVASELVSLFRGNQTTGGVLGNMESPLKILYSGSAASGGTSQAFGSGGFGSSSTGFRSSSTDFGSSSTGFGSMSASSSSSGMAGTSFGTAPSGFFRPQEQSSSGTGLFGKPAASSGTSGTGLFGKPVASGGSSGISGSSGRTGLFGKPAAPDTSVGNSQSSAFGGTHGGFGSSQGGPTLTHDDTKSGIYTPLSELTPNELEQFQASTFTIGSVPTRPPPLELCR